MAELSRDLLIPREPSARPTTIETQSPPTGNINDLIQKFERYRSGRTRIETEWRQADKSSLLYLDPDARGFFQSHPGEAYRQADTMQNKVISMLIRYLPNSLMVRSHTEPASPVAHMVETVLRWQVQRPEFITEMIKCVRDAVKYGTGIVEVELPEGAPPRIICRTPWNVYPSPGADSIEDSPAIFVKTRVQKKWLEEQGIKVTSSYPALSENRVLEPTDLEDYAEIIRVFEPNKTTWILNRKDIIAVVPWLATRNSKPAWPLFRFPLYLADSGLEPSFWGRGVYAQLAPVEADMIELRNIALEALKQSAKQLIVALRDSVDPTTLARRLEHGVVFVDQPGALQAFNMPDTSMSAFIALERMRADAQNMTALHQFVQGSPQAGVDTATEFQGLSQLSEVRMLTVILNLQTYLLQPLMEYLADLWINSVDPTITARLIGHQAVKEAMNVIDLDEETEQLDIQILLGVNAATAQTRLTKAIALLSTIATIPGFKTAQFITDEILRDIGVVNPDKYFDPNLAAIQLVSQLQPFASKETGTPEQYQTGEQTRQETQV